MLRYFDAVARVVARHGGTIEKFIGDAAMAVFGAPVALEDHALRAIRAAQELEQELTGVNERPAARVGDPDRDPHRHQQRRCGCRRRVLRPVAGDR